MDRLLNPLRGSAQGKMNKNLGQKAQADFSVKKPYVLLGLSKGKKNTGGRNNQGKITAYHRGGGNKLRYISLNKITGHYALDGVRKEPLNRFGGSLKAGFAGCNVGSVRYIVRDPNRTALIAGVYWSKPLAKEPLQGSIEKTQGSIAGPWYNYYSNIIAPEGLTVGSTVTTVDPLPSSSKSTNVLGEQLRGSVRLSQDLGVVGNKVYLKDLMVGTLVHNIDDKYIRAAGCSGIIISKTVQQSARELPKVRGLGDHSVMRSAGLLNSLGDPRSGGNDALENPLQERVTVKLQSGQYKIFSGETLASIGVISNGEHKTRDYRKAGQKRWLGRRPIVRGVAMNPIDHPHGGGEGKSSGGRPSVTPWGKPTKGKPTRSPKKPSLQSKADR